jgi:hypothetical protein
MLRLFLIAIVALSTASCVAVFADWFYETTFAGPHRSATSKTFEVCPPVTRFAEQPAR